MVEYYEIWNEIEECVCVGEEDRNLVHVFAKGEMNRCRERFTVKSFYMYKLFYWNTNAAVGEMDYHFKY